MYSENQLLPISALQHLIFCERQCALIHVEQLWAENVLTVEGRQLHEKADKGKSETAGKIRIARSLWLKSSFMMTELSSPLSTNGENPRKMIPIESKSVLKRCASKK